MEKRYCKKCGKLLSKNCKGEYCNIHRDRTGVNNPFFGKKHSEETKKKLIKSCSEASKKLWENDEYRKKVIENATGIKRSDEFKEKQRLNAILQFKNEEQRKLRSNSMKESWKKGLITSTEHLSTNSSKQEKEFIALLSESLGKEIETKKSILYKKDKIKKHIFPDGLLKDEKIVLEFNGSFWHADPRFFNSDDIVHHGITAKNIWKRDKEKINELKKLGYKVFVIWSKDYLDNKNKTILSIKNKIEKYDRNKGQIL